MREAEYWLAFIRALGDREINVPRMVVAYSVVCEERQPHGFQSKTRGFVLSVRVEFSTIKACHVKVCSLTRWLLSNAGTKLSSSSPSHLTSSTA